MEETRKWELIASWLEGDLSEPDKSEFEDVKTKSSEDVRFASTIWYNSGNVRAFQVPDVEDAIGRMKAKLNIESTPRPVLVAKKSKPISWARYAVAASVAAVIAFSVFNLMQSSDYEKLAVTASAQVLPDNSTVRVEEGFISFRKGLNGENREVTLKGRAVFEVEKDASRPFVVKTQDTETKVLGTKFTISERQEITSIEVMSGKVQFSALSQQVVLVEGEAARFDGRNLTFTKANDLIFKDESVEAIANVLREKLGIVIEFTSPDQKQIRLNLSLNPTLERRKIAVLLSEVSGLVFEIKQDRWVCKQQ